RPGSRLRRLPWACSALPVARRLSVQSPNTECWRGGKSYPWPNAITACAEAAGRDWLRGRTGRPSALLFTVTPTDILDMQTIMLYSFRAAPSRNMVRNAVERFDSCLPALAFALCAPPAERRRPQAARPHPANRRTALPSPLSAAGSLASWCLPPRNNMRSCDTIRGVKRAALGVEIRVFTLNAHRSTLQHAALSRVTAPVHPALAPHTR